MQMGNWQLTALVVGRFRLDGGAMFGVVPKTMWAKRIASDSENRIPMVTRALVARGEGRVILVDTGAGGGYDEKMRHIYAFDHTDELPVLLSSAGVAADEITDVFLTHLHFDHGAGVVRRDGKNWSLIFPAARHHVQQSQWEHAMAPNPRDRASYFSDRLMRMEIENALELHDGPFSLAPDFDVETFDGHTPGQQLPRISGGGQTLFFGGDLIPTRHHLPTPYVMAYDLDPVRSMAEKAGVLRRAASDHWVLLFEHDADAVACTVQEEKGRFSVLETTDVS